MIIELIIALVVGVLIGTITGLIPGIHINLVAALLISISAILLTIFSPVALVTFVVALAITHTFVDYIPSVFLGAPDETSFLSVLPGHELLLQGRGYYAIIFTLYGCLIALPIILILTPAFILFLPIIYPYILRIMPIILILFSIYLIITEKGKSKKLIALIIFLFAGFLGIAALNVNLSDPLLPLFTGLFGASGLVLSINQKTKIPEQKISRLNEVRLNKKTLLESSFISLISSPIPAFLPALGSSQAALIGTELSDNKDPRQFLFLVGAINIIVMALSFVTFYSIQKSRTGAAVAVSKLIPKLTFSNLIIILMTIIISGIFAFIISIKLAKFISKRIHLYNYSKISLVVLIILTLFTIFFTGFLGLLVFIISTALGITAISLGIKRSHLMGCLLIPTILYYIL